MSTVILPARGGSKRIVRKNIRPFAGRPMLVRALDVARDCGLFDRIVVSTDDPEIAALARAQGAEVPFMRPPVLANDQAGTLPVVRHALQALGTADTETVFCLYPCVPLLAPETLRQAQATLLELHDPRFVFPVLRYGAPIQRALRRLPDGRLVPLHPEHALTRTQDLEPAFHDAGQFYCARAWTWRDAPAIHAWGHGLPIPPWQAVDIDTEADWIWAERLYLAQSTLRQTDPADLIALTQ